MGGAAQQQALVVTPEVLAQAAGELDRLPLDLGELASILTTSLRSLASSLAPALPGVAHELEAVAEEWLPTLHALPEEVSWLATHLRRSALAYAEAELRNRAGVLGTPQA